MSENADAFNTWDQICLVFFEKSEFSFYLIYFSRMILFRYRLKTASFPVIHGKLFQRS